jgi:hypothetical protein
VWTLFGTDVLSYRVGSLGAVAEIVAAFGLRETATRAERLVG